MVLTVNIRKQLEHFELQTAFSCPAGELTAIVGPSGAGKSTLIRIIAGLESPDSGIVSLNGTEWVNTDNRTAVPTWHRKIGLVFQEFTLFPHLSVRGNVAYGAPDHSEVDELMDLFGILHLAEKRPAAISGGERQRAAFCQALAREPDVLLLDEPFSALDVRTRGFLCEQLDRMKQERQIPILHVTHDLEEAARLGDAVIAVQDGLITPGWFAGHAMAHHGISPVPTSLNA